MRYRPYLRTKDTAELLSLFSIRLTNRMADGMVKVLRIIEKIFPGICVEVPHALQGFDAKNWGALVALQKLHDHGVITGFSNRPPTYPDEPSAFSTRVHYTLEEKEGRESAGRSGFHSSIFDLERTFWPAIGEALERWSLDTFVPPPHECITASFKEVQDRTFEISDFAGFPIPRNPEQPKYYINEHTPLTWVRGFSLISRRPTYIPLQLIGFLHREKRHEPLLSPGISTGAASGQTLSHAITSGILEIIERDALMINWLNQLTCTRIDLSAIKDPHVQEITRIAERYRIELCALKLFTDMPVHIFLVFAVDRTGIGPAIIADSKAGFSFMKTLVRALDQVISIRATTRNVAEKHAGRIPNLNPSTLNQQERFLYWSSLENLDKLDFWLTLPPVTVENMTDYNAGETYESQLSYLRQVFKEKNYAVVYKEILPSKISDLVGGIKTVVVRIPQMQPMSLYESEPCFSGPRLTSVPQTLGLAPRKPLFTDTPHPFL